MSLSLSPELNHESHVGTSMFQLKNDLAIKKNAFFSTKQSFIVGLLQRFYLLAFKFTPISQHNSKTPTLT